MDSKDEHRLFVGKIPSSVHPDQLSSYFSQFGVVKDVLYPQSNRMSKIAFVTYGTKEEVDCALSFPHELAGSKLNVTVAQPRSSRGERGSSEIAKETRIFIGGVPPGTVPEELEDFFSKFGRITKVTIPPTNPGSPLRGYAFITFSSPQEKENALASTAYHFKNGEIRVFAARPKNLDFGRPSRNMPPPSYYDRQASYMDSSSEPDMDENPTRIFVGRLPNDTTKEDLREHFSHFGETTNVVIPSNQSTSGGEQKLYGFVSFKDTKSFWKTLASAPHTFKEYKIEVIEARPKGYRSGPGGGQNPPPEPRIFVGRIPDTVTEGDLKQYFNQFGDVKDIFRPKSNAKDQSYFVFLIFDNPVAVAKVLAEEAHSVSGHRLNVTRARPRHNRGDRDSGPPPPPPPRSSYGSYSSSRSPPYRPYPSEPQYDRGYYHSPPPPPPPPTSTNPYLQDPYTSRGYDAMDTSSYYSAPPPPPYPNRGGSRNVPQYGVAPIKPHHRLGYAPY